MEKKTRTGKVTWLVSRNEQVELVEMMKNREGKGDDMRISCAAQRGMMSTGSNTTICFHPSPISSPNHPLYPTYPVRLLHSTYQADKWVCIHISDFLVTNSILGGRNTLKTSNLLTRSVL